MHQIQYLPHTADVRISLIADSFEELFQAGVKAIAQTLKPGFCELPAGEILQQTLSVESIDKTSLLIDFLSDILSLSYTEKAVFCEIAINCLTESKIMANVMGHRTVQFEEDIKAVTYHEAQVRQKSDGRWATMLIFDI